MLLKTGIPLPCTSCMCGSIKRNSCGRFSVRCCRLMRARSGEAGLRSTPSLSTRVTHMVTLGISTNTRLLGLAIIKQGSLEDYNIHLHKSPWSPAKATDMIVTSLEPCVRQYCIKRVVLSIPYAHHQTEAFKFLVSCIREYFAAKSIPVYAYTPEAFHSLCPAEEKKTKKALMQSLTLMYPQLSLCYHKEMRNKKRYYIKVFEAVAVAALQERE